MTLLRGRNVFLSGGSRGIGLAIALRAAADGANIAIAAKTDKPHPRLSGTIHTAAEAVREAGGEALPVICDIRDDAAAEEAVARAAAHFGGIDVVINNASAISITGTLATEMKRYDLMASINARGTFLVTRACLPHLLESVYPRILTIAPPLDFSAGWFRDHSAYSLAKYGMGVLAHGWAAEFQGSIASNCLWPRTTIDTAAVRNLLGGAELAARSRKPEIMANAAHAVLARPIEFTGWFCLDDLVLAADGERGFDSYSVDPAQELAPDFFVPRDTPLPGEANGAVGWRAPELGLPAAPD